MKKTTVAVRFLTIVALALAAGTGAARAASSPAGSATLETVTFEIRPDEVTARIATSVPVPKFQCDFGPSGDPVLTFTEVASRLQGQYEPPVAFLGAVRVEAPGGGARGQAVLRFRTRSASLVGIEQRADGVALRFVATNSDDPGGGDYRLGIGDKLEIAVFGHDDLVKTSEVGVEGTINFPLVGDLKVEGRTIAEIDDELTKRLASEYLVDPQVSVEVKEFRSQWVTLMGEVRTPGRYVLRRNMRLLDVIAEAGGPTKEAGQEIAVTRHDPKGGKSQQLRARMDDLLTGGSAADNLELRHGDIISVGERAVFYIRGEVNRPSAFVLERGMTIMRAIAVAGGLTQYANRKEVQLVRSGTEGALESTTINLKAIEDGKVADQPLRPDDVIIVPRRIF